MKGKARTDLKAGQTVYYNANFDMSISKVKLISRHSNFVPRVGGEFVWLVIQEVKGQTRHSVIDECNIETDSTGYDKIVKRSAIQDKIEELRKELRDL